MAEPKLTKSWAEMSEDDELDMDNLSDDIKERLNSFESPTKSNERKYISNSSDNCDDSKVVSTTDDFIEPSISTSQERPPNFDDNDDRNTNDNSNRYSKIHNIAESSNGEKCEYGISCNNYHCEKEHPVGRRYKCKFGEKCNRPGCKFLHPKIKTNECKFGINCTNIACKFQHPGKKEILVKSNDLIDKIKGNMSQYWQNHPESKPLDIKIVERKDNEDGIGCKYCYDAYRHSTQSDCPCRWTLKINKNGEFQEISCQDCKSLEWIKVNSTYQNCLVDSFGCPYAVRLDTNGFPCKCIHPYAMCPYYGLLHTIRKYETDTTK